MPNEYPEEFVDSIIKPMISNDPSSDTIYHGTVIIPHVKISPRYPDALETVSTSGPFSRLSIHSVGH
jgi:hypothetical protein